jgi:membrane protein YdbS with pleckstrin-like domain
MTMPTTPAADGPHRETDDTETVYFEGSPLLRGELHSLVAWGLAGVVVLAAAVLNLAWWHQHVPAWAYAVAVVVAVGFLAVPSLLRRTIKYRITNYRIDVTRGLLARTVDTLELWHVEDLRMRQSIAGRIFNCGTITVLSHNASIPRLEMFGLPAPQELFRHLEQRVIAVKRQRGVMKIDTGT